MKSLSDDTLQLVDLHNYEVMNADFPGDVKDMTCTMFHKRNLRTDLANWRGIMLSNFIANSPMTWLTNLAVHRDIKATNYTRDAGRNPTRSTNKGCSEMLRSKKRPDNLCPATRSNERIRLFGSTRFL